MTLYVAELYDDRHPEDCFERSRFEHTDPEQARYDARNMLNSWADPDDGVRPIHLCSRVMKIEKGEDGNATVSKYIG